MGSKFSQELKDPWGLLIGATAGGAAWAVNVHPAAAVAVGVAAWVAKAFASAWQETAEQGPPPREELPVTKGSAEAGWLSRAERAARDFADLTSSMRGEVLLDRIAAMRPQVDDTVATLRRLAGHASITGTALARFDPRFLQQERHRLTEARKRASPEVAAELDRSLGSVNAQQEVVDRLSTTRDRVLARLESGTMSLEGLVARAVEVGAMSATYLSDDTGTQALDELTAELELTRQSLHEVEQATKNDLTP
ncbi:hypothetical protein J5X84_02630 [Streptosporangiaceae bacterium NEAU-GS5]|nr:hypothetical protein [Streptosporangiaceae bacterium NEAU-GS5]